MALHQQHFQTTEQLDAAFAEQISQQLSEAISAEGSASLFVSGGRTPVSLFQTLSKKDIDWSKVVVSLVDERWVDEQDSASNTRLVQENLLQNNAAKASYLAMKTAHADAYEAQSEVEQRLGTIARPFTVLILGMGEDSHTASLFPCSKEVQHGLDPDNTATCLAVTPTTAPHQRMSLTLRAIADAKHVYLHLTGEKKKHVLETALSDNSAEVKPIASVIASTDVTLYWAP